MSGFNRQELLTHARGRRTEFEDVLKKIVEIPSVSVEPERKGEVHRAAEYAVSLLQSFGAKARLYETKGHPIVHGRFDRGPDYPTVTVYNHLDVQPAEGPDWNTEPFAFIREGDVYRGRGTTDDKGPAMTALFGARYAFEQKIPLNIHFLWELEEEIGSPSFETTIRANAREFATDSIVVSRHRLGLPRPAGLPGGPAGSPGLPLRAPDGRDRSALGDGGRRGAQSRDRALSAGRRLRRREDRTGQDPRLLQGRRTPPTKKELEDLKKCGFTVKDFKKDHLFRSLRVDDAIEVMKRIWMMPTFEVHGIAGGYQGPGVKTIIPPKATAIISCRLVPKMSAAKVVKLVKAFVKDRNPDVKVSAEHELPPYEGKTDRAVRRRDPRRDEVRVRPGARLRARGRLDRRRAVDGEGAQGSGLLPRALPSRARLPRAQRELRLAAGRGRHRGVRGLLPETLGNVGAGLAPALSRSGRPHGPPLRPGD